jgi:hypothetical protein
MQTSLPTWLQSSVDSQKVSKTVTGLLTLVGGMVILYATHKGMPITTDQYTNFVEQAGVFVTAGVSFYGAIQMFVGIIYKVIMRFHSVSTTTV